MSSIRAVTTVDAPRAIGIYSQAVRAGDTVCLAGPRCFGRPGPARAAIGVGALPREASIEVAAVPVLASKEH